MNLKSTAILFAAMAMFSIDGAARAQDDSGSDDDGRREHSRWHARGPANPERMVEMMTRRLGLDEVQAQNVANIITSAQPEFETLRENGQSHRAAMRELDVSDPDYGTKLQNLAAEKGELAAAATQLRGRIRADIHAVLTPDQQAQLAQFEEKMRDGRGFRGRGRGWRGKHDE